MIEDQRLDPGSVRPREPGGAALVRDDDCDARAGASRALIASMSACRLLPRPEMSTPIARRSGSRLEPVSDDHGRSPAPARSADAHGARFARGREHRRARDRSCAVAHTRISPIPMLNVRSMSSSGTSPAPCSHAKIGGTFQANAIDARRACPPGRMRGRLSVMPAAGDVRHALDEAGREQRAHELADTNGAAREGPRQSVDAKLAARACRPTGRRSRTRCAAPASSRWCAGRTTAGR